MMSPKLVWHVFNHHFVHSIAIVLLFINTQSAEATDYDKARQLGLNIGKIQYSEDVKKFLVSVDDAFDKHDYISFGARMRSPGDGPRVVASLDWAQGNMMMGASVIVPIIYAESLWSIGSNAPAGSQYVNFKETSAFITLYSLAVIITDGPKCADHTAPDGHFTKLISHLKPVILFLKQLPDDKKNQVVGMALNYEAKLSPIRSNDNYLCRFGMDEIGEGLKGKKFEELPQRPPQGNEVGTQVGVPSPPGYEPKYLPEADWRPKQEESRKRLPALLATIVQPLPSKPQ